MRSAFSSLVALLMAVALGVAEPPAEKTGLKLGDKAAEFKLKDQKGDERSLGEFLAKGKVALVFYRSAGW